MDRKKLLDLRVDFYRKTRQRVQSILGQTGKSLGSYQKKYEQQLKRLKGRTVSTQIFFAAIEKAQFILVGDFHSEGQSARSLLRICRELKSKKIILALECVSRDHQSFLDGYLKGDISEKDFLKLTKWDQNWGFHFNGIKPLLEWSQSNQEKQVLVFGINFMDIDLNKRDQKIAQRLYEIKKKHPEHMIVVQIGDYHLAEKHLPLQLGLLDRKIKKNIHVVYQSPEDVYFNFLKSKKEVPDFMRFTENRWAVLSVLPWVKWQNYLLQLEKNLESRTEQEIDLTDHVALIVRHYMKILGREVELSSLSVTSERHRTLLKQGKSLKPDLKRKISADFKEGKSFYIPEMGEGILGSYTLNHVARLAAQYTLYKKNVISKSIVNAKDNFLRLIWVEMLIYFLIKLINPKKKTNTLFDIRTYLNEENFEDQGREALTLALEQKLLEMTSLQGQKVDRRKNLQKFRRQEKSYYAAAEILGGILGEKVFAAFKAGFLKFPQGENLLFKNIESELFNVQYYEALEIIESWPEHFNSKYELF